MNAEKRWLDFPALLSLVAALLVAASRLSNTEWTEDLAVVIPLTVIGAILGALLGYSRFSSRVVILFSLVYTAFFVPWQLGLAAGPEQVMWVERLQSMWGRMSLTITQFLNNQPSADPLLFVANMALLFWLLALSATYQLIRHARPWQSLIIAGITLVIVDLYSPGVPRANLYSAAFVLLALLLLVQVYFMKSKARWRETGVAIDSDIEFTIGRGALIGAVLLILLAWNVPSVVLAFNPGAVGHNNLYEAWTNIRQRFENATAALQGPLLLEQEYFGEQLGLGTGSPLSDEIVFTVKPAQLAKPQGVTYYWRGRSYDYYDPDTGWDSTINDTVQLEPNNVVLPYPEYYGRIRARFTIQTRKNLGILYTPSLPMVTSRSTTALIGTTADGQQVDTLAVYAEPPVRGGETYEVLSWISAPTIAQMQQSGTDYPDWVREYYLQLPDQFPERIRALAEEITAGLDNPYDKTAAITRWLRLNMTYEPVIDPIPEGADPIEYFLFESKTGFCNYYATAEILMLRSIGIPARLAGGYAQGEYNPQIEAFEVRRRQSHSWPEVFFAGIGWVEFEPTVSQPEILRLPGETSDLPEGLVDRTPGDGSGLGLVPEDPRNEIEDIGLIPNLPLGNQIGGPRWLLIGSGVTTGLGLILALIYFRMRQNDMIEPLPVLLESGIKRRGWNTPRWIKRWSHLAQLNPIERSFLAIYGAMLLLRKPLNPTATPAEAVIALERVLPSAASDARALLVEYQRAVYSQHPANIETARLASRRVMKAVGQYWLERLFNGRIDEASYGD